jgi:hypothetical protein
MLTMTKVQPVHSDGFQWQQGLISDPKALTLIGPEGEWVGHAYRGSDKTWLAVWSDGEMVGQGFASSGEAIRAIDDLARPCAYVDRHPSHGIVPCDLDREPGSMFCENHGNPGPDRDDMS